MVSCFFATGASLSEIDSDDSSDESDDTGPTTDSAGSSLNECGDEAHSCHQKISEPNTTHDAFKIEPLPCALSEEWAISRLLNKRTLNGRWIEVFGEMGADLATPK